MACCAGVYFAHVPLDFEVGVKALSLTASLAAFIVAGFTEDERCPEGRRSSDGLKQRCSAIVKQQDWCTKRTCEKFSRVQNFSCLNFRGFYFRVSVVGRENRENLDLAKISRYTVAKSSTEVILVQATSCALVKFTKHWIVFGV